MNFDRVADAYEETRRLPVSVFEGLVSQMAEAFGRGRVLDAGVGTGRFAVPLAAEGLDVVGVDISRRMMDLARQRGAARLVQADLVRLPFRDQAFDHALAVHVLHLLPDWRDALREIVRVTRTHLASMRETKGATDIRSWYDDIAKQLGWTPDPLGRESREILDHVPTVAKFPRLAVEETIHGDGLVDLLARKTFSHQWDVPDDIHAEAIRRLREEYGGKEFHTERTWELMVWRVEDLADL